MSSHGVFSCWPANEASGLSRASSSVPLVFSMTMRPGVKMDRLSWPAKTVVTRSVPVSAVMVMSFSTSGFPLTCQIAPVIDRVASIAVIVCQRSRPPWALIARFRSSFMFSAAFPAMPVRPGDGLAGRAWLAGGVDGLEDDVGDDAGIENHGHVRCFDRGDVGVGPLGHEHELGRRDGVVLGADHGPGRDGFPGRDARLLGQGDGGQGKLGD